MRARLLMDEVLLEHTRWMQMLQLIMALLICQHLVMSRSLVLGKRQKLTTSTIIRVSFAVSFFKSNPNSCASITKEEALSNLLTMCFVSPPWKKNKIDEKNCSKATSQTNTHSGSIQQSPNIPKPSPALLQLNRSSSKSIRNL